MQIKGFYYQPAGELTIKIPFYATRYNNNYGHMSQKPLGLQALVLFLGSMMWINIRKEWL